MKNSTVRNLAIAKLIVLLFCSNAFAARELTLRQAAEKAVGGFMSVERPRLISLRGMSAFEKREFLSEFKKENPRLLLVTGRENVEAGSVSIRMFPGSISRMNRASVRGQFGVRGYTNGNAHSKAIGVRDSRLVWFDDLIYVYPLASEPCADVANHN